MTWLLFIPAYIAVRFVENKFREWLAEADRLDRERERCNWGW